MGGSLVAGILTGDAQLIGKALDSDAIVEPVRGPLIPGFMAVKEAAKEAGGLLAGSGLAVCGWRWLDCWWPAVARRWLAACAAGEEGCMLQRGPAMEWRGFGAPTRQEYWNS